MIEHHTPPSKRWGRLFTAVQLERIYSDSKTFADAVPRRDTADILADFSDRTMSRRELTAFVIANFKVPENVDVAPAPTLAGSIEDHITTLWPKLTRSHEGLALGGSELRLPCAFVVPGGRFRENYYWDAYYTMLGLLQDGQTALAQAAVDNATDLIERYGRVPNGARTYFLTRSQPPHYALMVDLVEVPSASEAARRLAAMQREHAFWMRGQEGATPRAACARVACMPDGSLLNRYWDDCDLPRDEAMAEDVETAAASQRISSDVFRNLRAGAESGWDYSSRWLADETTLASIRTTEIVPMDLNALLFTAEVTIAHHCARLGQSGAASTFVRAAQTRREVMLRWLWVEDEERFADFDLVTSRSTPSVNAAVAYVLAAGIATTPQAEASARLIEQHLLAAGGLRTTNVRTGQQWDAPNGWAPIQWTAIVGLRRYGFDTLAREIARRWLTTVIAEYRRSGRLLEKYDVEQFGPGGGGEYPLQDGFGWTNGTTKALLAIYPDLAATL